ncbi:M56 family metallopeptidase [Aquimarina spongiae]|uniref:Signal transducer regulating beta-lactamase production, contains metallopeptidase domain n=1 Tax=Aquimarina spongiae TaxID=570521 RepID=A0A1M6I5K3_9FLAO|nr:M56 family metallopeptidase [Aquimarina spongiae]SHJ29660.1 Signal transducer regulating beta-lactamase production, contains metallopeptidase domain [Aquimarina spongiae]
MIAYILKSTLCLVLLWAFYRWFLEKESMHVLKRFYLLFSLVFAYTIPLITITYTVDVVADQEALVTPTTSYVYLEDVPQEVPSINYWPIVLWTLYGIGALIFGTRFLLNLRRMFKKITTHEQLKTPSFIHVLLGNTVVPHSFWSYIFVPGRAFKENKIPKEVLLHEQTHVAQKHTLDILFVEIMQVIFWFNPMWYWIKRAIKLNHEFLADQSVLHQGNSIIKYIDLLVGYNSSPNHTVLASSINYSLTKKRIVMMSQQFSRTKAATKLLLLLPLLFGCMLLFTNEIVAQQRNVNYSKTVQDSDSDKQIKIKVTGNQITVNGKATSISNFATVIDNTTKQWKDEELKGFNFDVKLQNANDDFIEAINREYKKTRLYRSNPEHDLIPSAPPLPPAPIVRKGEASAIPPPPKETKRIKRSGAPAPPTPPGAPTPTSDSQVFEDNEVEEAVLAEIEEEEERRVQEIEEANEIAMVSREEIAERAREAAERAREIVEASRERAKSQVEMVRRERAQQQEVRIRAHEEARKAAMIAQEHALKAQRDAERARERAIKQAMESRKEAMFQAEKAREQAMKQALMAREEAEKARAMAMEQVRKDRELVAKEREQLRAEARKSLEEARKEAEKARKKARKELKRAKSKARKDNNR